MRKALLLLLACILSSGCTSPGNSYELPEKYAPLEFLKPRSAIPGLGLIISSKNVITTIGNSAYVKDVDEYLSARPPTSVRFHSIMRHEQEHSKRQLASGTKSWISKYVSSKSFAWEEEKIGWYYELTILKSAGYQINVDGVAKTLAGYKILTGSIVSFEDAKVWVQDVLAGQWKPAE